MCETLMEVYQKKSSRIETYIFLPRELNLVITSFVITDASSFF